MKPKKISDIELAFPANVTDLMPTQQPEFKTYRQKWIHGETWGFKLFNDMFYRGVHGLKLQPKEGIDPSEAFRHIRAIMASFSPSHEDKTASCAMLFEQWFESGEWQANKEKKDI